MTCSKNDYEIIKILDNGKYKIRYLCCGYETEITERTIQAGPKCRRCNQKTRKTHEQFLKEVKELTGDDYEVLSEYFNAKTKVKFRHKVCGHEFEKSPNMFLRGQYCPKCGNKRSADANRKSLEDVLGELNNVEDFKYYDFISMAEGLMIKLRHTECGNVFDMRLSNFRNGQRCPRCMRIQGAKKHMLTQEEFEKRVYDMYQGEYSVLGKYTGHKNRIKMKHNKCGHEWEPTANNFLRWRGCPECFSSAGERRIAAYLANNGYTYQKEFKFPELAVDRPLRYDFVVFTENLPVLIEYDGVGHFQAVGIFGKEGVKKTQEYDTIKSNFAEERGIPLIRIGYKDFNKIEKILTREFQKISANYEEYKSFMTEVDLSGVGKTKKGVKLTIDDVEKIGELLQNTDLTYKDIGCQFGVSSRMVSGINAGKRWIRQDVNYPIRVKVEYSETLDRDELVKDIATMGFKATGEKHGCYGNKVKSWCRQLGLPTNILDIQKLYGIVPQIRIYNDTEEYSFDDIGQCVDFLEEKELTTAGHNAIRSSVKRVLRGDRKSYLGYRFEEF